MRRTIRILALSLTLITGALWAALLFVLVLFIGGWTVSSFRVSVLSISGLALLFAAPISLVSGSMLGLLRKAPTLAIGACSLGSLCLSVVVGQTIYSGLQRNSAQSPPGIGFLAVLVMTAFLCDLSALWLGLDWKRSRSKLGAKSGTEE